VISPYAKVSVVGNKVKTTRILNLLNDLENVCIQFLSGSNVPKYLTITNLYPSIISYAFATFKMCLVLDVPMST